MTTELRKEYGEGGDTEGEEKKELTSTRRAARIDTEDEVREKGGLV